MAETEDSSPTASDSSQQLVRLNRRPRDVCAFAVELQSVGDRRSSSPGFGRHATGYAKYPPCLDTGRVERGNAVTNGHNDADNLSGRAQQCGRYGDAPDPRMVRSCVQHGAYSTTCAPRERGAAYAGRARGNRLRDRNPSLECPCAPKHRSPDPLGSSPRIDRPVGAYRLGSAAICGALCTSIRDRAGGPMPTGLPWPRHHQARPRSAEAQATARLGVEHV